MSLPPLTFAQKRVLDLMVAAVKARGRPDSYEAMGQALGCTRPNVCVLMKALVKKGYVVQTGHARRPYTPVTDGTPQTQAQQAASPLHPVHEGPLAGEPQEPVLGED